MFRMRSTFWPESGSGLETTRYVGSNVDSTLPDLDPANCSGSETLVATRVCQGNRTATTWN